ncbi:exonuclease domain-containing protein [Actinokineospora iranica]|uniref:DNA polymerase-3 subunit epsilon n=1 Tax=Actinokineospora iranica TaxID=1271860 RepID=A0A1G6WK45_9PSEU|nr:exonuclease domain-containing protein [Actinokineospora iranica]SDD66149.1 DNA polymerase-3 subunit epsilon [Actinokineospora iranica]
MAARGGADVVYPPGVTPAARTATIEQMIMVGGAGVGMATGGYAVVDVETTGLAPRRHDRIAEIAVVWVDRDGNVTDEWCTLVNPRRDLGPQRVHGIRAADARRAPVFAEIAADVADRLRGRVLVAHNLRFDAAFLAAEFGRLGVSAPVTRDAGLCTMALAPTYLRTPSRSLAGCCAAAGVEIGQAHSALADARACAHLLAGFLDATPKPEPWADLLAGTRPWPALPAGSGRTVARGVAAESADYLTRLVDRLPRVPAPARADEYLALLDRALRDRVLALEEQDALTALADSLGLSFAEVTGLHRRYLSALALGAVEDGVVTDAEHADLTDVAGLLGLPATAVDTAIADAHRAKAPAVRLDLGDAIAFTGELALAREDWLRRTQAAGLTVTGSGVTKKTRLVVAADPDSLSGKADKARRYGIPIVTEAAYAGLLADLRVRCAR